MEKESLKSEIQKIPIEKRQLILDWAIQIKEIQNNKILSNRQKIQKLKTIRACLKIKLGKCVSE